MIAELDGEGDDDGGEADRKRSQSPGSVRGEPCDEERRGDDEHDLSLRHAGCSEERRRYQRSG